MQVVSDASGPYGRLVLPQDPNALARAQLEVFAMTDDLLPRALGVSSATCPNPSLDAFAPFTPGGLDLHERFVKMRRARQALAMKYRVHVKTQFQMEPYLKR
jgi:hypothetical protein